MSDYSSYNNVSSALKKAREVAAKLQLAAPNKRSQEDFDDHEPHSKRPHSMSPAHLQQAQHAAAQVAARLGQQQNSYQQQQQHVVPNPDAVEKAKQLISKFIPQGPGSNGPSGALGGGNGGGNGGQSRPGLGASSSNFVEIMVPGSKVGLIIGKGGETIKQLQERTGAKMVVIQDGPTQEMEKPLRISGDPLKVEHAKQLVYELIEDKGNQGGQGGQSQGGPRGGNGGGGGFNNRNQDHQGGSNYGSGDQIEVFVPKVAVGVVIGKGGDMIKKIQAETGCRLQFLQTKTEGPGDRRCILQGTKQQVDDGRRMIEDLIDSVIRRNGGEGNSRGSDNWNNSSGGSSNYQQHQQSQQSHGGGASGGVQVVQHQYQFIVPASKCGIIIGRGGDTIKQINQQSGAHCEMDRKASQNQTNEKTFTIKGEQHQVDEAKRAIQDKINMDVDLQHIGTSTVTQSPNGFGQNSGGSQGAYGSWGNSGSESFGQGGGGWDQGGNPPQMPTATAGQPDYSLQWIEYYRSMGMHAQANAIEAQIKTRGTSNAPTSAPGAMMPGQNVPQQPQSQPSGQDSTKDYSQEWAAYYRQIGRVDEAEAIERQIKVTDRNPSSSGAPPAPGGNGGYPGSAGGNYPPQQQQQQQQYPQQYGQYGNYNYQQYGQNNSNDKNW